MAELTVGAVTSLRGVLRNEAHSVRPLGQDVEFIKEEMESMNSFLEHLARTTPPGGDHDDQVRAWMKQVRDLAYDCSDCIELYLRRGDPAIYRARGGLRRYTWWAEWLVQEMLARHAAAVRLRKLKERARDVANRWLRYGVEVPPKPAHVSDDSRHGAVEPSTLDDLCARKKLREWLKKQAAAKATETDAVAAPYIFIVVPDAESGGAIADEAVDLAKAHSFERSVRVNLPKEHLDLPLLTTELFCYILHKCEDDAQNQSYLSHRHAVLGNIWNKVDGNYVYRKISKLMTKVRDVEKMEAEKSTNKLQAGDENNSFVSSKEPKAMSVLLQALWLINKDGRLPSRQDLKQWSSFDKVVKKTAEMLKEYIEKEHKGQGEIRLDDSQYEDILRHAYTKPASASKREEEGSSGASATTDASKEVTRNHKITLEIMRDLPAESQPPPPGPQPPQQLPLPELQLQQPPPSKAQPQQPPPPGPQPPAGSVENVEQQASQGGGKDETKEGEAWQKTSMENKWTRLVIKGTVDMVTLDALGGGKDGRSNDLSTKKPASTGTPDVDVASAIKGAKTILSTIGWPISVQLVRKGIVDKIKDKLNKGTKTLIILQDEKDYVSQNWEDTRKAFGLLGSSFAVIIFTTNNQKATE